MSRWDKAAGSKSKWDSEKKGSSSSTSSSWDEKESSMNSTPMNSTPSATPLNIGVHGTPSVTPMFEGGMGYNMATPSLTPQMIAVEQAARARWEREMDDRNKALTDDELDAMLPQAGYKILEKPENYVPLMTPARRLMATPSPSMLSTSSSSSSSVGYLMPPETEAGTPADVVVDIEGITIPPEEREYFKKLLRPFDESTASPEELKERNVLTLLLKIKNGTPQQRKVGMRVITEKAREFGPDLLFENILPMMQSASLEEQERHLLVKVINRVLFRLDDLVARYVHKILVVIEPLLIDQDFYARVEGREVIANLAKAAGLARMLVAMKPDLEKADEYIRNTTSHALAIVASALGIPALLPFLRAVCASRKLWYARHTGIKVVQHIASSAGCGILPYLNQLVECIAPGLRDDQMKVRIMTALSLAALAQAAAPFGFDAFEPVLKDLAKGIPHQRGKVLAAFIKAMGCLIPLMDTNYAEWYTRDIMKTLVREFYSPDDEMKKIVMKVLQQCIATDGVTAQYIRDNVLADFFRAFWIPKLAIDYRNYKQVVESTVAVAGKVGGVEVVSRIVPAMRDPSEVFRRMVVECIDKIVTQLGASDIDDRLEQLLVEGILFCLQELLESNASSSSMVMHGNLSQQDIASKILLNGFGTVVNALGARFKAYIPRIISLVHHRLGHKDGRVRQQAADIITKMAPAFGVCGDEVLLLQLSTVLNENLGEEFPEVLGSILGALKAIINVVGMHKMQPPISDLLPRLSPILRNRHEKVQENVVDLVGRIADKGAEYVSPKEWMRICFELLDMLNTKKKGIRRAATNTFGFIARAVDPHEVLSALLKNLKVQERTNRVSTTVAIAIVAEQCRPFVVLPALMNEYRVPELNVQNGVLKSLSFLFEYIGETCRDYIYALTPLLENALIDRDLVHRQTAASALKHLALGVVGLGREDAVLHLFNCLWPNVFETSPHVISAVFDAVDGCRVCLGPGRMLYYVLQGLYHPARKVRAVYWRLYNMLYIGHQDSLVAFYPVLENDPENIYTRPELEFII